MQASGNAATRRSNDEEDGNRRAAATRQSNDEEDGPERVQLWTEGEGTTINRRREGKRVRHSDRKDNNDEEAAG